MAIDINGTVITANVGITVSDTWSNKLYVQTAAGIVLRPQTSTGTTLNPLFVVGWYDAGGWVSIGGGTTIPFAYTGGNGYYNIGACYNTSNYRFTAPWTGLYLFKNHIYHYNGDASASTYYLDTFFTVNGSNTTRRPGGPLYRRRHYGLPGSYGWDTDMCEIIYLTAADYVSVYCSGSLIYGYSLYSSWCGSYLGN